jgi:cytochrome o ubiquinol oxidase subunit 2
MHYVLLTVALIGVVALGGCAGGVLNPMGPVSLGERDILFNSTGIMLAIVIPTVLATLGVAFWFRASTTVLGTVPN